MRELVVGDGQELLADQLRHEERLGLIGDDIVGVVARTLRETRLDLPDEHVESLAGQRRDRNVGVEPAELGCAREPAGDVGLRRGVDLVHHEHRRRTGVRDPRRDEPVARTDGVRRVDHETDDIDLAKRRERTLVGPLAEQRPRLVDTGRVEEDDLTVVGGAHTAHLGARRLRPVGDDRHLRADEAVDERGLADVRPPYHRHEAAAKRLGAGGLAHDGGVLLEAEDSTVVSSCSPGSLRRTYTDTMRCPCTRSARNSRPWKHTVSPSSGT